ncbi:MAG TPA: FecR domain-containing protein [Puia sp.]|jgi:ferric-dicitrate binding protein FerR (iron transport regulator)
MSEFAHKISGLIIKFHQNELSPEEQVDLQEWRQASADNENLFLELTEQQKLVQNLKLQEEGKKKVLDRLIGLIPSLANKEIFHINWRYVAAAGLILFCGVGYYFVSHNRAVNEVVMVKKSSLPDIKAPSGSRTILTLADGSRVDIDSMAIGRIARQGEIAVTKGKDGQLIYQHDKLLTEKPAENLYNTLSTIKGGSTLIALSDGTKVWLNSASSIRFPTIFLGNERNVELTGEAYFEVAHNKSAPFRVRVMDPKATILVLGTHFDVQAYPNEPIMKTTLLQGSIALSGDQGQQSRLIPGQQAQVKPNEKFLITNKVDTAEVVAWKNGKFRFNITDLSVVLRQLERWYDIEVVYETHPVVRLTGTIPRDVNLSNVMELLEMNGVHLKLEGKKLTVLK